MIKLFNSRGDTIVEVMMSLAVLSLVLGGAYISTNTSLRNTRQAQERGEALKLTEQQIELLKAAHATGVKVLDQPIGQTFCIYTNPLTSKLDLKPIPPAPATFPPECQKQPAGGVIYKISINRSVPSGGSLFDSVFNFSTTWDRMGGGTENLTMAYRL